MAVVFDGPNRQIIVQSGTDVLSIQDVYSRWVDWLFSEDNAKYPFAFEFVGGNPTVSGQSITFYFFLLNGWKIDACCEFEGQNHALDIEGIILSGDGSSPFWMDPEMPMTMVRGIVPIRTETVNISGGTAPSAEENAGAVWATLIETGFTAIQIQRLLAAILAGKTTIEEGPPVMVTFRDVNDTTDRVIAEIDGSERVDIALDAD